LSRHRVGRRPCNARNRLGKSPRFTTAARRGPQSLQTDPIGDQDDPNLYAYVKGDPVNDADPTGTTCTGTLLCDSGAGETVDRFSPGASANGPGQPNSHGSAAKTTEKNVSGVDAAMTAARGASKDFAKNTESVAHALTLAAAIAKYTALLDEGVPADVAWVRASAGMVFGDAGAGMGAAVGIAAGALAPGAGETGISEALMGGAGAYKGAELGEKAGDQGVGGLYEMARSRVVKLPSQIQDRATALYLHAMGQVFRGTSLQP
jgi:uncharacterized protein RhaS with RHS repeats